MDARVLLVVAPRSVSTPPLGPVSPTLPKYTHIKLMHRLRTNSAETPAYPDPLAWTPRRPAVASPRTKTVLNLNGRVETKQGKGEKSSRRRKEGVPTLVV